jgi:hypothetical protein
MQKGEGAETVRFSWATTKKIIYVMLGVFSNEACVYASKEYNYIVGNWFISSR